jgi:hypothetical protein
MNMPRFAAEASLYKASTSYLTSAKPTVYDRFVQPAGSDTFDPSGSSAAFLSTQLFDWNRPVFCLRWKCDYLDPNRPWQCTHRRRTVGVMVDGVCV